LISHAKLKSTSKLINQSTSPAFLGLSVPLLCLFSHPRPERGSLFTWLAVAPQRPQIQPSDRGEVREPGKYWC